MDEANRLHLATALEILNFFTLKLSKISTHYCQIYEHIKILSIPLIGALETIFNGHFYVNSSSST